MHCTPLDYFNYDSMQNDIYIVGQSTRIFIKDPEFLIIYFYY